MKKLIAITLALVLICTLIVPASAVTTMHWDWGKARASIGNAAARIIQEQTEPTETEYTVVEETETTVSKTEMVEPLAETTHEREQSWRDWFQNWGHWIRYERE